MKRYLHRQILKDLQRKMVLLSGPRQVGKTTLANYISKNFTNHLYFNWDIEDHRTEFINNPEFFTEMSRKDNSLPLVVFDEIHKYKNWKNYLKGVFDQ